MTGAIHVYDEDRADLESSQRQLHHRCSISVPDGHLWMSRVAMLSHLEAVKEPTVVLVDLQSDDFSTGNFSGHRIIETIARSPRLLHCRPVAYSVHAHEDIVELARGSRACALISKNDLDLDDAGTGDFLRALVRSPVDEARAKFSVRPGNNAAEREHRQSLDRAAEIIMTFLPEQPDIVHKPYFWDVVRALALTGQQTTATRWVLADHPNVTPAAISGQIERLRSKLPVRYRTRQTMWDRFAQDLLSQVPSERTPPQARLASRWLPSIAEYDFYLHHADVRRASFADDEALEAIDRVAPADGDVFRRAGHSGHWSQAQRAANRMRELEPDPAHRQRLSEAFVRGVWAIFDTARDWPAVS